MSCISITGSALNFAQAQPTTVVLVPPSSAAQVRTYTLATGVGNLVGCKSRTFQNLGGTDVTVGGTIIPALASWVENSELDPESNVYYYPAPVSYDATGGRLLIIETF